MSETHACGVRRVPAQRTEEGLCLAPRLSQEGVGGHWAPSCPFLPPLSPPLSSSPFLLFAPFPPPPFSLLSLPPSSPSSALPFFPRARSTPPPFVNQNSWVTLPGSPLGTFCPRLRLHVPICTSPLGTLTSLHCQRAHSLYGEEVGFLKGRDLLQATWSLEPRLLSLHLEPQRKSLWSSEVHTHHPRKQG